MSASGIIVMYPSPTRDATSVAFGPKPETSIGTGSSGTV
ncbi:hypothetical protein SGLAM104S_06933 [Streptomyces glaucescens]